jgi:ABC-type transport system involved in multi-copper enzyme maturation permease subunit
MPSANLARLALIEARRGALPWLAIAGVLAGLALAAFLSQVALTESRALQLATVGALGRACAVFLVAAHVATSVLREMNDKGLELMLSLPLPRSAQYLGRLAGFAACGAALAVVFAAPLLLWAAPGAVALWALSLALECAVVAAATLFFAVSLGQLVAALATTAGFYLLGRSITSIQAIAASPLAEDSATHDIARWGVEGVALLLPRLDAVTRTEWLLYATPEPRAYLQALAGLLIYGALVVAAGLFDFQRESF